MNNTKNVYCRLCAELKPHNKLINLQTDEEMCHKVVNKLSRFNIVLDFQENILPKTVCLLCVKSLERAFTFVTAVDEAQAFLSDFILVHVNTAESNSCAENIFHEPPDVTKDIIDGNIQYPMEVNVDSSKLKEEYDTEIMNDVNNTNFEINIDSKEYIFKDKYSIEPFNVINEEETYKKYEFNNVEDDTKMMLGASLYLSIDCGENHDSNVDINVEETNSTILYALKEKQTKDRLERENNSEPIIALDNTVYSVDYIKKQNNGIVSTDVQYKHEEHNSKQIAPELSDNTVYSTHHINQQNHSIVGTRNKGTDVKHKERNNSKPIPPKLLDNMVNSEDYINKKINRLCTVPVQHVKMTWMDYEWKCSHCGTIFSNIDELQKHSIQYHNFCNPYQCTDCKVKKQHLNAFIKHVRTHRKYLHYSCYKCFEKFPKRIETKKHTVKIHDNSDYICSGCNTPFSSNKELDEHVSKYYKILLKRKVFLTNDSLTCNTCNKVCANIAALRSHLNTHKEKNRDHVCDRCGKSFFMKQSLRIHMGTHSENILHHCEICKATFKNKYTLQHHASIHSGIRPFACDVCGKCFRSKNYLEKEHMKMHTTVTLPYTCTVCNKKCRSASNLQNHMLQHTGEKPFSCDVCLRDFTNLSNRNKHMRRRHGIEMVKKRQSGRQQQTDEISPDLATRELELPEPDETNESENKIMKQENKHKPRTNKKIGKLKSKECNEN